MLSESVKLLCLEEDGLRKRVEIDRAISNGNTKDLKIQLVESPIFLEGVMSNGYIEKIWQSNALGREEIYRLSEIIIKAMVLHSNRNAKIKAEMSLLHSFLKTHYEEAQEKMKRLRLFRLLEACGMGVPTDPPVMAKNP